MKFVTELMHYSKEYESPGAFWRWASYAAISATLRNNIFYDHGMNRTYPNLYVLLLADSAEHRKGPPCALVSSLLNEIGNTKVIVGRGSIQGIIEDLANDISNPKTGVPLKGGSCILIAEELSSFFVSDASLVPLLTDLYEPRAVFTYRLKSTGITTIKDLCVTLLAASNAALLKEVYTDAAIQGGLLGRSLVIAPDETRPPNSLLDINVAQYNPRRLLDLLSEIKKLKGPVGISAAAKSLYTDWYTQLYYSYKDLQDRTGMSQRMHRNVLKLAMILAASDISLLIDLTHMEEAIMQVTSLRPNYDAFVATSTIKPNQSEIGALLLQVLWASKDHTVSKKQLLLENWQRFSSQDLDSLIFTLETAGLVQATLQPNGELIYSMTTKCLEIFQKRHLHHLNGNLKNSKGTIQ